MPQINLFSGIFKTSKIISKLFDKEVLQNLCNYKELDVREVSASNFHKRWPHNTQPTSHVFRKIM
jgi:hypothetical protein